MFLHSSLEFQIKTYVMLIIVKLANFNQCFTFTKVRVDFECNKQRI